jgi:hypothetical protein
VDRAGDDAWDENADGATGEFGDEDRAGDDVWDGNADGDADEDANEAGSDSGDDFVDVNEGKVGDGDEDEICDGDGDEVGDGDETGRRPAWMARSQAAERMRRWSRLSLESRRI